MARGMAKGKEKGIEIGEHLSLVCEDVVANDIIRNEVQNSLRFTHTAAMSEAAAKAIKITGIGGFEGYVHHSPTLGDICLQPDANCKAHHAFIIEPSSFFWITTAGMGQRTKWLTNAGSRIWAISGDTLGTPTTEKQSGALAMIGLQCDQPGANVMISHIKSSRE